MNQKSTGPKRGEENIDRDHGHHIFTKEVKEALRTTQNRRVASVRIIKHK